MSVKTSTSTSLALFVALMVMLGIAAAWGTASLFLHSPCSWMALVTAADAAIVLRLAGLARGRARARWSVLVAVLAILAGGFAVAALQIGAAFGSVPHEAVWNIGPGLARTWWQLNAGPWDIAAFALALPLAWWLGH